MTQDKMASTKYLSKLLDELELKMRQIALWRTGFPQEERLMSQEPFAIDTLEPSEWLQWIFIEKLRCLIDEEQPIPKQFNISPYFEQCWGSDSRYLPMLMILKKIDVGEN